MDKNFLLDQYSHSVSNNETALKHYCLSNDVEHVDQLIAEFNSMQRYLLEYVQENTEDGDKHTPDEVAEMTAEYCKKRYPWINPMGIHAMNRWLMYKCWDEGILVR